MSLRVSGWMTVMTLLLAIVGCNRGGNAARYSPPPANARSAVETALSTWKSGAAHGPIKSSQPEINVFDARWSKGKKLDDYEILEEIAGQEQPQFKVRMKLAGQPEETTTYRVIGINPLNVFREEDYQKATAM